MSKFVIKFILPIDVDPTKFTFLYSDDKISSPLKESKATGVGKLKDRDQKISLVDSLEFGSGVGVQQTAEFAPVTFNTRQQSIIHQPAIELIFLY